MSYPTCSGISCSADCADRDPRLRKDDVKSKSKDDVKSKSKDDVKSKSKDDSTKAQSGRSMIEMLGVLAIIGVLSVGGIAGYSKAMMQYKINKTADQITQIVGNVRTLFGSQKNYDGLFCWWGQCSATGSGKLIKKAHLVPDEMWNSEGYLENVFGGEVVILTAFGRKTYGKAFEIALSGIPEEACMALATYDWGSGSSSGLLAVGVNYLSSGDMTNMTDSYSSRGVSGDGQAIAVPNGSEVSVPMPVNIAASACEEGDTNKINLVFY